MKRVKGGRVYGTPWQIFVWLAFAATVALLGLMVLVQASERLLIALIWLGVL